MESEQSQNFNERLSQWVASQGFWFQIRYSMVGSGAKGTALFHLLRMGFRVLVFLLILAVGAGYYLFRRTGTKGFHEGLQSSLKSGLSASEIELRGVSHVQGELGIGGLACKGESNTFFSSMDARNIHCNMGYLDGIAGQWKMGTVSVARLDMELRAGADDAESARMLGDALFKKFGNIELKALEITDTTLRWGYSRTIAPANLSALNPEASQGYEYDHTRGSISNSFLRIQRDDDALRLSFKGGKFSQNWLEDLEIVDLEVVCNRDGMVFQKAEFRRLQGTVDFSGLKVTGGARPLIDGTAKIRHLAMSSTLPPPVRNFVEGSLSGDFHVTGSTNSSEGIIFEGGVTLDSQDMISLRERLHLLKALSIIDYARNYHRIDFREGSFHLKIAGGGLELTDLSLKSDDMTTLEGKLSVRLPTAGEMSGVDDGTGDGDAPIFNGDDTEIDPSESKNEDPDITLRKAAEAAKKSKEAGNAEPDNSLFNRLDPGFKKRQTSAQTSERLSRKLRYEGEFKISLPPDAFERAPKLIAQYPLDAATGRIPLRVPIEGELYEITWKQAGEIYQQGRR